MSEQESEKTVFGGFVDLLTTAAVRSQKNTSEGRPGYSQPDPYAQHVAVLAVCLEKQGIKASLTPQDIAALEKVFENADMYFSRITLDP